MDNKRKHKSSRRVWLVIGLLIAAVVICWMGVVFGAWYQRWLTCDVVLTFGGAC